MLFFKISSNKNKERDRFFLAPGGVRLLAVSIVLLVWDFVFSLSRWVWE
jgi:hypothetical protein